jgi:hypothetical protein
MDQWQVRGTDVGMGIDPQDRQIIAVTGGQLREGGHAHRALPAQRDDMALLHRADAGDVRRPTAVMAGAGTASCL